MQRYRLQGHSQQLGHDIIIDLTAANITDLQVKLRDMFAFQMTWEYCLVLGDIQKVEWKL